MVKTIRYYLLTACSHIMIIALPIPQITTTNNNYTHGEKIIENIIQGEKISEKPYHFLFTAPYNLCENGCSGQEDNFAMAFPLYVGEKGKEQYKNRYPTDFIKVHSTKPNAPFKKRSTINPLTFCPTEITTFTQPETFAMTFEQSTVSKTTILANIVQNAIYETETSEATTQATAVFDIEIPTQATEETPTPTVSTTVLVTEFSTPTTEEESISTFESTTDFKIETNMPAKEKMPTPTTVATTYFETLTTNTETARDFVTKTSMPTTEQATDFETETSTPTTETITVFLTISDPTATDSATYFETETLAATTDTTTAFVTKKFTTTETTTDFEIETPMATTVTTTASVKKTPMPNTEPITDFGTDTPTFRTETTKFFETKAPWSTTGISTVFETETNYLTIERNPNLESDTFTQSTKQSTYLKKTNVIPATESNTIPYKKTPILITKPNLETIVSVSTTDLYTIPKTFPYPVIVIIINTSTTQMSPESITNFQTISSRITSEITFPETLSAYTSKTSHKKETPEDDRANNKPTISETDYDYWSYSSLEILPITTLKIQITKSPYINRSTYLDNKPITFAETDNDYWNYDFLEKRPTTSLKTSLIDADVILTPQNNASKYLEKKKEEDIIIPDSDTQIYFDKPLDKEIEVIIPGIDYGTDHEKTNFETVTPKINISTYPDKTHNKLITLSETDNAYWSYDSIEKNPSTTLITYLTDADVTKTPKKNGLKNPKKQKEAVTVIPEIDTQIYPNKPYDKEIEVVVPGIDYETDHETINNNVIETVTTKIYISTYPAKENHKPVILSEAENDSWSYNSLEKNPTSPLKTYLTHIDVAVTPPNNGSEYYPEKGKEENTMIGIDEGKDHEEASDTVFKTVTSKMDNSIYPDKGNHRPIIISDTDNGYWSYGSLENLSTTLKTFVPNLDEITVIPEINGSKCPEKDNGEEDIDPEQPFYNEKLEEFLPGIKERLVLEKTNSTILDRLIKVSKTGADGTVVIQGDDNESDKMIPEIYESFYPEKVNGKPIISETEYESLERLPTTSLELPVANADGLICPKPIRGVCKKQIEKVTAKIVNLDVMYSDSEKNNYLLQ